MWDNARGVLYAVEPTWYDLSEGEFDPDLICGRVRLGGGTGIKLQVHSELGHTYYPSEIAPLAPEYEVGRDYPAEFIEAARRHGLQLVFSINSACNPQVAAARPEWRQIGSDGRPARWQGLDLLCMQTGYKEYFCELLREFVAQYLPDCICIDNFVLVDGCRCDGCIDSFQEETGLELPSVDAAPGLWRRYTGWRLEQTERLGWQVAMAAKSVKGDLHVAFSGASWETSSQDRLGWRLEKAGEWMDNAHSELAVRGEGQDLAEGELIGAYYRALGKAAWCALEYSPAPFARLVCPPAELRLKAGTIIGSGCQPCVSPLLPPSWGDDSGLRYLGDFLAQFSGREEWLDAQGSFARTAVLHSAKSPEATGRGSEDIIRAWCRALTREHVLWDFVLDRHLRSGGFAAYRVLIVPGTAHIEPRDLAAIDAYVRGGGAVVFVGEATCWGADGERLSDFAAGSMMGVRLATGTSKAAGPQEAVSTGYLRIAEGPLDTLPNRLMPTAGHVSVDLVSAQPLAHAVPAERSSGVAADSQVERPAITWRMHGGGKVVHVAAHLHPLMGGGDGPAFTGPERLIGELVRWLGGERIRVRAPRDVSVFAYRAPRGATIHVLNRPPSGPYIYEHVVRTGRLEIVVPQSLYVANVAALDKTAVQWDHKNDRLAIAVSNVAEYRCLCVEGALG